MTARAHIPTSEAKARAAAIAQTADSSAARIRADKSLSPGAVRAGIARTQLAAKREMDRLAESSAAAADAQTKAMTSAAWGTDDLATTPVEKAAVANNYRSALDRAEAIDSPTEAKRLLQRAVDTGDELMARAIAKQAFDRRAIGSGWEEPVKDYLAGRPKAQQAVNDLIASERTPEITDLWAFVLPEPAEVKGLAEHQLEAIANDRSFDSPAKPALMYEQMRASGQGS